MDERTDALQEVVALARQHGFSISEIADAIGRSSSVQETRRRAVLVRVLGFLGGTFVFAGVGVFIALQWEYMNSAARVVVTLGSGLAAFVLAVLSSRDIRFDKAATPLLLMSAALEPTGMLVAFSEFGAGGDWRWASLVTSGTVGLQFGAAVVPLRRSTPLFLALLYGVLFWWTALDIVDADGEIIALVIGSSMLLAAIGVDRTRHRDITPVWYFFGAASFLYGLFDGIEGTWLEIVFLAVAAGFVYLSVVVHSRALLIIATAAILGYTGWFTSQHFVDSIGWPIALILFGIAMIALSALAFRIDREYLRAPRGDQTS